jgi:hypothetical protein
MSALQLEPELDLTAGVAVGWSEWVDWLGLLCAHQEKHTIYITRLAETMRGGDSSAATGRGFGFYE